MRSRRQWGRHWGRLLGPLSSGDNMPNTVLDRIHSWYSDLRDGQEIEQVSVLVQQLAEELYSKYEPTGFGPHPDFWNRLDKWLNTNLSTEDQKLLFRLVPH